MRLIDAHAHLWPGGEHSLLSAMDSAGIERACLSGLGPIFGMAGDDAVFSLASEHPDRIVPFAFVRPGRTGVARIKARLDEGFRGIKVSCPAAGYDAPEYADIWELAAERDVPLLFHTGLVTAVNSTREDDVSSVRMNPVLLEPVARNFPRLRIVCAHLGIHWNDAAAELARFFPNVRVDLTGELAGWRARWEPQDLARILWWPGAFDKVIFGTDVPPGDVSRAVGRDLSLWESLSLGSATRERIAYRNALWWLGEREEL